MGNRACRGARNRIKATATPTARACGASMPSPRRSTIRNARCCAPGRRAKRRRFMQFPKDVAVTLADVADLGRLVPHDAPHQGVVIEVEPLEDDLARRPADRTRRSEPSCWSSTRSPTRIMSARSCAPPRPSARSASSPRTAIRRPKAESSPRPRRARSSACRGRGSSTSPGRSRRSARPASGGSAWLATPKPNLKDALGPAACRAGARSRRAGLRPNTREHCDALARLPISDAVESLNVSNAAAVALYAASIA